MIFYICIISFLIICIVILVCIAASKKRLEHTFEAELENIRLQQKYFENRLQQNEEILKFRHDMNKHMKIIKLLCDKNEIEELKNYVNDFIESYPVQQIRHTGHFISDYFINETVTSLQDSEGFKYYIYGNFPNKIAVSNKDLSIIMANALDNAKNALIQVEGKSKLIIEIGHFKGRLIINIENTKSPTQVKKEKMWNEKNGYGLKNIQDAVDRYGGTMKIYEEPDWFVLKIMI